MKQEWASIYFNHDITEHTPSRFREGLTKFVNMPVRVFIDSVGGRAREAWQIFEMLKKHNGQLMTIVYGQADSAAVLIFLAGQTRVIEERSTLMIHDPVAAAEQTVTVSADRAAEDIEAVRLLMVQTYSQITGLQRNTIADMMRKETRLDARAAVRLGFAHTTASNQQRPNSQPINVSTAFGMKR